MDWPATRNALGPDQVDDLADALAAAGRSDGATTVILTGASGMFCSGGDLRAILDVTEHRSPAEITDIVYGRFHRMLHAIKAVPVPVIAAVDGPAVGLGMDLVLACDLRILGSGGYLRQGWARVGLVTGTGGVGFLDALAPGLTWDLLSAPRDIDGTEGAARGLVIASDDALSAARERAAVLARLPIDVLKAYVALERGLRWPSEDFLRRCAVEQGELLASARFRERAEAILSRA